MSTALEGMVGPTTAGNVARFAGNLLRVARLSAEMSTAEVASRAGVDESVVVAVETAGVQPTVPELYSLIAATGMELRAGVAEFDDHDRVLDRRAAQHPEVHAAMCRGRDDFFTGLGL